MTSFQSRRVDPNSGDERSLEAGSRESDTASQRPGGLELTKYADLIASGEVRLPAGLTRSEEEGLLQAVQVRRRRRLVKFVARAIAQDILRSRGQHQGGN